MAFYYPTDFGDVIAMWQSYGGLPIITASFVIIFAVIYAILQKSKVLGAKPGIDSIIAIAIAFIALLNDAVPFFFNEILFRTAIGLAILVVMIIFFGLFISETEVLWKIMGAIGALIIFVAVLIQTYAGFTLVGNWWWDIHGGKVILGVVIATVITVIITSTARRAEAK